VAFFARGEAGAEPQPSSSNVARCVQPKGCCMKPPISIGGWILSMFDSKQIAGTSSGVGSKARSLQSQSSLDDLPPRV
jgi:hypothetical protein